MEAGNLAWWEMDLPSGKVKFNKRKAKSLGYPPKFFSHYTDFTDLLHSKDHDRAMKAMRDHLEGREERYEVEYRIEKKNGNYKWFRDVGGITEEGKDGDYRKVTGIVIDIDDQKKAEEELKESERKYRLLAENTTDVIFTVDMDLNLKYVSPSVEALFGYTPQEAMKLNVADLMPQAAYEKAIKSFRETVAEVEENRDFEFPLTEYKFVRRNGSTFWGELNMKFLRDQRERLVGAQGILRDITERKEREKEIQDKNEELRMLTEKLKVVGKMARHDVRNKLSTVNNNLYLARPQLPGDHEALRYLEAIKNRSTNPSGSSISLRLMSGWALRNCSPWRWERWWRRSCIISRNWKKGG